MKGTTSTGFKYEIDKNLIADDWELLELLVAADAGDNGATIAAMKQILGANYDALKEHVRKECGGRVRSTKMRDEFMEILNSLGGEVKNS